MTKARIQKFLDAAHLFRCPICGGPMTASSPSVRCEQGHTFDISSKGHLTFAGGHAPLKGYDRTFFESRARICEMGLYDAVADTLLATLDTHGATGPIVDAGCGEGHHAKRLANETGQKVIALDYSKDAIACAARGRDDVLWLVADLANIPLRDLVAGCVVNVFTPANYAEFKRVLRPGGLIIKVVPGPLHMRELREIMHPGRDLGAYSNRDIVEHLERNVRLIDRVRSLRTHEIPVDMTEDIVRMSPVSFGIDPGTIDTSTLQRITVDAEILVARAG
ncbi:MAG: methyltransferase domain-containing protein [Collinsella sp.]|nr:methyltransferase domain-containing protein [Collinsella sp.]